MLEIFSDVNIFLYLTDDIPALNPNGLDLVLLCIVKCHACDFDIKVSLRCCGRSQEFDANNMVWLLGFQNFMFSRIYCYTIYILIFVRFGFLCLLWLIDNNAFVIIEIWYPNDCFAVLISDLSRLWWKVWGGCDKDCKEFKLWNYAFGIFCLSWDSCTLIVAYFSFSVGRFLYNSIQFVDLTMYTFFIACSEYGKKTCSTGKQTWQNVWFSFVWTWHDQCPWCYCCKKVLHLSSSICCNGGMLVWWKRTKLRNSKD